MIKNKYVILKWNPRNKSRYVNLGYKFTQMGKDLEVKVQDLSAGSNVMVDIVCDYCGKTYKTPWYSYVSLRKKDIIKNDCCKDCAQIKARESINEKYGSYTQAFYKTNKKRESTNLIRYQSKNVFGSEKIKSKIVSTNLKRYGVPYSAAADTVKQKRMQTCLNKYGVKHYVELFKGKHIGEMSPRWKGGIKFHRVERASYQYIRWRNEVYSRDHFTCQHCGSKNGDGTYIRLNAHHIKNWKDNVDCRYDVNNGITFCERCHLLFHSLYKKHNNTYQQVQEFLNR